MPARLSLCETNCLWNGGDAMRRVLALLAVTTLLVAGCARPGSTKSSPAGPVHVGPGIAEFYPPIEPTALDNWRDFPATAHPRPIVLIYGPVQDPGYQDGDFKERAMGAGYTLPALPLPQPAPTVTVTLPDGPATLPTVSAAAAFQTLQSQVGGESGGTLTPLPIVSVSLGDVTFRTDRGDLTLPAWQFTAQGGLGPIAVPALAASVFWHYDEVLLGSPPEPATVSSDGRTVHMSVPTGVGCDGSAPAVTAMSAESAGAVAVGAQIDYPPQPSDCAVPAIAKLMQVTVVLKAPLAGRVLVTGTGAPVAVTTG